MKHINPTFEWYSGISTTNKLSPRCPFRSVHRCPKYFLSVSTLDENQGLEKDYPYGELMAHWIESEYWPLRYEDSPGIRKTDGKTRSYDYFCPEAIFDQFKYFASHLWYYPEGSETGYAHEALAKKGIPADDSRWYWGNITPQHYTECALYSLLSHKKDKNDVDCDLTRKEDDIIEFKPSFYGISLNPKAMMTKLAKWWLKYHG